MLKFIITLVLGFLFGAVLIASEAFSWYRIQEMFYFESFHMYGLLFSAIETSAIFVFIFKRKEVKSIYGEKVTVTEKQTGWKRSVLGGLIFGVGWAISGACTAPIYVLVGFKWEIGLLLFAGALLGTYLYSLVASKIEKK